MAGRDVERVTAMLRHRSPGSTRSEIGVKGAEGAEVPTLFALNDLEIEGARVLCLVVTDLTEQKRAEAIVPSETLARAILEQAAEAVVVVDPQGAIVRASQAAHKLAGENVLFRAFENALPLSFLDKSTLADAAALRAAACGGRIVKGLEAKLPCGSAPPAAVLVSAGPLLSPRKESLGCVVTITDITLRKQVEERIGQAQKMESLGRLAGGIAHDFNNLLTGIVGNASLITNLVDDDLRRPLEDIVSSGQRAADLTRQLLAYAGKGRFLVESLDLSAVVQDMLPLIRASLPKKAGLAVDLCGDLPHVEADRNQIQQVILNLAINAGESLAEAQGEVAIRTCTQSLSAPEASAVGVTPGEYLCLRVADNGCGMDEGTLAKIFDPFFTTKFVGRGLGLAAVQGIVRGCEGAVKAESRPGEGSVFTVLLPVMAEATREEGGPRTSAVVHETLG